MIASLGSSQDNSSSSAGQDGYKARLRYEGFEEDSSQDFWCSLGSGDMYPIGWVPRPASCWCHHRVLDRTLVSRMRLAVVDTVTGGRLKLVYDDREQEAQGEPLSDFWCHMWSPLLHPVDWSIKVGHVIKPTDVDGASFCKVYCDSGPMLF
ncbi:unnamed protein product [Coregonus sp. 'balchen']|nr:unnamed protein product [Coregonus sp. 'balchen']